MEIYTSDLPHPPPRRPFAIVVDIRRSPPAAVTDHGAVPPMRRDLPPRYLRSKEAAEFLSLSARTLEKHRTYGTGPPRLAGAVEGTRMRRRHVLTAMLAGLGLCAAPALAAADLERLGERAGRALPCARGGRHLVRRSRRRHATADLAVFLAERGALPRGVPMLKHVAALAGATVCRKGAAVFIDGRRVVVALPRDCQGRPLSVWSGCRALAAGEIFLLIPDATESLGGRRFGPLPARSVGARLTAPMVIDGAMNGGAFRAWVRHMLAPSLGAGDIVVMDNLAAHKVGRVREMIESRRRGSSTSRPTSRTSNPTEQGLRQAQSTAPQGRRPHPRRP